jgi:hypothetical protein
MPRRRQIRWQQHQRAPVGALAGALAAGRRPQPRALPLRRPWCAWAQRRQSTFGGSRSTPPRRWGRQWRASSRKRIQVSVRCCSCSPGCAACAVEASTSRSCIPINSAPPPPAHSRQRASRPWPSGLRGSTLSQIGARAGSHRLRLARNRQQPLRQASVRRGPVQPPARAGWRLLRVGMPSASQGCAAWRPPLQACSAAGQPQSMQRRRPSWRSNSNSMSSSSSDDPGPRPNARAAARNAQVAAS